ncbi:MAG: glycosyltransferase family 4 protein [Microscillaceae bacterium]|nr:glycosyltransferase family 4 protein [Microscillaceae bacterium]
MPSPIKVLFISYDGLTDPLGQSQVLPYLEGLSRAGYEITVLSAEKRENFARRAPVIRARLEARGLHWAYIFYTKKPPVFSTLWDLRQMRRRAIQLHRQSPFALLHCRSYLSALWGNIFSADGKCPLFLICGAFGPMNGWKGASGICASRFLNGFTAILKTRKKTFCKKQLTPLASPTKPNR